MTDLAQSDVHGPVETIRTESAEWDPAAQVWKPPQHHTLLRFRPDGKLKESESHNSDGSIARSSYIYDEAGRLIETRFRRVGEITGTSMYYSYDTQGRPIRTESADEKGTRTELETYHYYPSGRKTKIQIYFEVQGHGGRIVRYRGIDDDEGAAAATMTTSYDDRDQPTEVLAHDATHLFSSERYSRMTPRQACERGGAPRSRAGVPGIEETLQASHRKIANTESNCRKGVRPRKRIRDHDLRLRSKRPPDRKNGAYGLLSDEHTTYRFDDHDNPIEEVSERSKRDMGLDPGNLAVQQREHPIHHIHATATPTTLSGTGRNESSGHLSRTGERLPAIQRRTPPDHLLSRRRGLIVDI